MIKKTILVCLFVLSLLVLTSKSVLANDINPAKYNSYREYRAAKLAASGGAVVNIAAPKKDHPWLEDEDYIKCRNYRDCRKAKYIKHDNNDSNNSCSGYSSYRECRAAGKTLTSSFSAFISRHFHSQTNQGTDVNGNVRCDLSNQTCRGNFDLSYKEPNFTFNFRFF